MINSYEFRFINVCTYVLLMGKALKNSSLLLESMDTDIYENNSFMPFYYKIIENFYEFKVENIQNS